MTDTKEFNLDFIDNLSAAQIAALLEKATQLLKDKAGNDIHITALLDISGSMSSIREDSIGGFNTFLKDQQNSTEGNAFLTLHLFDDKYETVYTNIPIADVKPLTTETFVPRGGTALTDALGKTLSTLLATDNKNNIIVILTDGGENASREFTNDSVKKLTAACEAKKWQFVYLGANQDSFSVVSNYGMFRAVSANYSADSVGTRGAYATASSSTINYRKSVQDTQGTVTKKSNEA